MDTRFLESFVAVVEHGSIAEAARRLGITPSALTQRLRAIEQELGSPLVSRSGRTVMPTATGLAIMEKARDILRDVRDLELVGTSGELAGDLRLGSTSTALTGLLASVLVTLAARHPRIDIYVKPGISIDLYRDVLEQRLDAAILVEPEFALPKTCAWRVLYEEPLVLLTPASERRDDPGEILRTSPFIRYDRTQWGGRIVERYLRHHGLHPHERLELDALDGIATLVDKGLGVAIVPDWPGPWPEGLRLRKIALPGPTWVRRVGLLWPRVSPRDLLIRAVLEESLSVMEPPLTPRSPDRTHPPRRKSD